MVSSRSGATSSPIRQHAQAVVLARLQYTQKLGCSAAPAMRTCVDAILMSHWPQSRRSGRNIIGSCIVSIESIQQPPIAMPSSGGPSPWRLLRRTQAPSPRAPATPSTAASTRSSQRAIDARGHRGCSPVARRRHVAMNRLPVTVGEVRGARGLPRRRCPFQSSDNGSPAPTPHGESDARTAKDRKSTSGICRYTIEPSGNLMPRPLLHSAGNPFRTSSMWAYLHTSDPQAGPHVRRHRVAAAGPGPEARGAA